MLDKFRNRFSFNFLAVCGWICFILFLTLVFPDIYIVEIMRNTYHTFDECVSFLGLVLLTIICSFISIFMFLIENIFQLKLINSKFVENKKIKYLQIIGIIFIALPVIILCLFVIYSCITDYLY